MLLDSADWKTRKGLLSYYGDTLKRLTLTANTVEAKQFNHKASKIVVQMLVQKVAHERSELIKHSAAS